MMNTAGTLTLMSVRVAAVAGAAAVFCSGTLASGGGWFEDERAVTLLRGLLGATGLVAGALVAVLALWIVTSRTVNVMWALVAALLLATPVDVVAPAQGLDSVRVLVVSSFDAVVMMTGLGPLFPYQDATVFPLAEGFTLPQSPGVALGSIAVLVFAIWRARAPAVRDRFLEAVYFTVDRERHQPHGH